MTRKIAFLILMEILSSGSESNEDYPRLDSVEFYQNCRAQHRSFWSFTLEYLPSDDSSRLWSDIIEGHIRRNLKTFIFKPKFLFLRENHKKDNWGELGRLIFIYYRMPYRER